jgi:xanthine dehydrogenase accessory factor
LTIVSSFYTQIAEASASGQPFALGIISAIKGSSPQKPGAKALFFADGRIIGTLGGGCLEAEIQDRARRALRSQTPSQFELVLDHDFGWDDGLICGGSVVGLILPQAAGETELWRALAEGAAPRTWGVRSDFRLAWWDGTAGDWRYRETVRPPCHLWIAGSGHVAQGVAPLALRLDFAVTVFDDRPALANPQFFPADTRFRVGAWEALVLDELPAQPVFGLIVTRGHQHDAWVLRHWIHRPFAFLGMIGSRRKARLIGTQFLEEKIVSEAEWARVSCPVGLAIQAQSVPEIAVSILAQMIQQRAAMVYETVGSDTPGGRGVDPHGPAENAAAVG